MIGYYRGTELIKSHLEADNDINTVVLGSLDRVDINKQTIFPLAHIVIDSSNSDNGMVKFSLTIDVMDVVDISKEDETEVWKGTTNFQDIMNTQHAVLENLERSILVGSLSDYKFEMVGEMVKEPFEYKYENLLCGWSASFDIQIPNEVQACGNSYVLGDITFSNTRITFSNNNNA